MTPSILIVGAGIGGLTLAQSLKRQGLPFDLVERAAWPAPVGAGLSLTINATRLLDALGFGDELRARGHPYQAGWIRNERGEVLQHLDLCPLQPYGVSVALHRAELHKLLSRGLTIDYGHEVHEVQWCSGRVQVRLSEEWREYSLIVAGDGLWSRVRASLPGAPHPVYSGYTSWRFVVPNVAALQEPTEFWGRGRRIGLVPLGQDRLYVFATLNQPVGRPVAAAQRGPLLRQLFRSFPARVQAVLDALTPDANVVQTDIHELKSHVWRGPQAAFLGDAAHAMTPNMGQGAGMSIEDAVVLAQCLHRFGVSLQALSTYEQIRRGRVRSVAAQSRWLGRAGQLEAPLLLALRDGILKKTPDATAQQNVWNTMIAGAPVLKAAGR